MDNKIDTKLDSMKTAIDRKIDDNKMENNEIFKRMDLRIDQLEKEMKNPLLLKEKTDKLRSNLVIQPDGIPNVPANSQSSPTEDIPIEEMSWNDQIDQAEAVEAIQPLQKQQFSSSWARQVSEQLKEAAETISVGNSRNILKKPAGINPKTNAASWKDDRISSSSGPKDGNLPAGSVPEKSKNKVQINV